jgi:virC1 protein
MTPPEEGKTMIITIGSYKGGTGKSTIATNLAAELHHRGAKVILIEADPIVGTSSQWAADREENGYDTIPVVRKTGRLKKTLEDFATTYNVVLVDAPGKDSIELRSAAVVSDLLIVPTAPTGPDLDSTRGFLASMDEARDINEDLKILVTISQANTNYRSNFLKTTEDSLSEAPEEFALADTVIYHRTIYSQAIAAGLSVTETENKKARNEIKTLTNEIAELLENPDLIIDLKNEQEN